MASSRRLQSISLYLLNSRGAPRLLASSAALLSSDRAAPCSSSPSLYRLMPNPSKSSDTLSLQSPLLSLAHSDVMQEQQQTPSHCSPPGVRRYLLKEGCSFGLPWRQKMSRSISFVRAPLLSPPSTEGKEQPVPSPLTMVPTPSDPSKKSSAEIDRKRSVQAVLKKIKESPKKVNLVAALVRGMQVQDALLQLAVLQKRAAKTVKRVVANARANATHNHGLNGDRLFVAEAFVGKGRYLKRLSYHAKGRSGIMHHPSCRLTVIVKELSDEQEAEIARYKTMTFRERAKVKTRLIPHTLIETTPHRHRTSKQSSGVLEA